MKNKHTPQRLEPDYTGLGNIASTMRDHGYAVLSPNDVISLINTPYQEIQNVTTSWDDLVIDEYLKDGGKYRQRRHASIQITRNQIETVPHRAHWQPTTYNALHGGMHRWFKPIKPEVLRSNVLNNLLIWLADFATQLDEVSNWFSEVHQFRIDTSDGIGRPTPEGAHRDGVDWVAVLLIRRHKIKGGETRVFEVDTPNGQRFTLNQPWSLLMLNDRRVIHETTPIQPTSEKGWRDTLVITLRADSFLDESGAS